MTRALSACVLVLFFAQHARADAAQVAASERALLALDDAARDAWLYGVHTLDFDYPGPSRKETLRALTHGVRLLRATTTAIDALETSGHDDAAAALGEAESVLAVVLCDAEGEGLPRDVSISELPRWVERCGTTSDRVEAVRDYVAEVRRALLLFVDETASCPVERRIAATYIRSAILEVSASGALARTMTDDDERREDVQMLRAAMAELRRDDEPTFLPTPESFRGMFEPPRVARYRAAYEAFRDASEEDRASAKRELIAAGNALATSSNPVEVEIAALDRAQRSLEGALARYLDGSSIDTLVRRMGTPSIEDVADLVTHMAAHLSEAACAPRSD